MAEAFTAISLEVYISGAWVDIWPDALHTSLKGSRGIPGNGIENRVGGPGRLNFSLDNSEGNTAGLIGRYSPGHANCLSGWTTGLPVRLGFTYDTWTVYKWYGKIEPDGIKPAPGLKGQRNVQVFCHDFMGQLTDHKLNLLTQQTNKTTAEAMALLLANMPVQPIETSYATSAATMPYIFDVGGPDTTALSEVNKIAVSQRQYIFVSGGGNGGEVLTVKNDSSSFTRLTDIRQLPKITSESTDTLLMETGDHILMETGDRILLDVTQSATLGDANIETDITDISYGKDITNYISIAINPREIDAAATTVLWSLEKATQLTAGASVTLRGRYNNPSGGNPIRGVEFVTPVSGTDYAAFANADGTGTDYTANMTVTSNPGATEVEFTVTNTHGSASFYFGGPSITFQLRGKGVYSNDPARVVASDATSQATHGVKSLNIEMQYQDSVITRSSQADTILGRWKNPDYSIDKLAMIANRSPMNMTAFLFMEPRDSSIITESVTAVNNSYADNVWYLQGYEFEVLHGKYVKWTSTWKKE